MGLPEILRREADRLLDRASTAPNWERQEELVARAEHLLNRAGMLESEESDEEARIRLEAEIQSEIDPGIRAKLQSALDNLTEKGDNEYHNRS